MLTKTAYLAYTQCTKNFWLAQLQPDLATPPGSPTQRRLRAGQEVDKIARERFPAGQLIPYRPHPEDMAPLTSQAIAEGAETLFQATFVVNDLLVKVDILTKVAGGWHLIEVKSSTKYKQEEHLPDVAFQVYVLQQAGIEVTQASLMHLNSDCRHPDLTNLFALTDVTDDVSSVLSQVADDADDMRQILTQNAVPDIGIGRHCTRPFECPFHAHCWQDVDGLTIYDIPYLKRPKEQTLEAGGIRYVADISPEFELGDSRANALVRRIIQQQIAIDNDTIHAELEKLVYPLYFFDFETIDYAVPIFPGYKPYQQFPFQYSCHILKADNTLTHCDFLQTTTDDPRQALAETLLDHIGETGHLVAYNISFERGVFHNLANQFPAYAEQLNHMADRLWDQLAIFRKHYRHYGFGKSNSLKSVLPVVVPDLSYKSLDVQNGIEAQAVWEEMIQCTDEAEKRRLVEQLRAYCHLDTLAMVEIHRVLSNL